MTFPNVTTLCVCLLASAAGFVWHAEHAGAADAPMEWQFSVENDQGNGSKTAHLIYAVPETDNVQVYGDCEAGQGKSSRFVFGADIGKLEKNKDVELRFSGGGFDHALKGKTHHPENEEDLSGVEVEIANDDPLWGAMDEKESLDYLVPGYKADSIDLTRGRDKIKQFLQTCRAYAAAPSGAQADAQGKEGDEAAEKEAFESAKELGTIEAWEAFLASYSSGFRADLARAYIKKLEASPPSDEASRPTAQTLSAAVEPTPDPSCKQRKTLRSKNSDAKTKITFINRSGGTRGILWLDFNGQPKDYANLQDGEEAVFDTFMTHPWMITDGPGNCLQIVMPHPGVRVVELGGAKTAKPVKTAPAKPVAKQAKKPGCSKGQIRVEGKCIAKQDAASFCGPGYRLKGDKCVQGYAAPKPQKQLPTWQLEAIAKGCKPGQGWNPQEGCHEND